MLVAPVQRGPDGHGTRSALTQLRSLRPRPWCGVVSQVRDLSSWRPAPRCGSRCRRGRRRVVRAAERRPSCDEFAVDSACRYSRPPRASARSRMRIRPCPVPAGSRPTTSPHRPSTTTTLKNANTSTGRPGRGCIRRSTRRQVPTPMNDPTETRHAIGRPRTVLLTKSVGRLCSDSKVCRVVSGGHFTSQGQGRRDVALGV